MYQSEGYSWSISADTHAQALTALYLRDLAGLGPVGQPAVSPAQPQVRTADAHQLTNHAGGLTALRIEWEQWWSRLVLEDPALENTLTPPSFPAFGASPALQKLLQAHYGAAIRWAQDRRGEYEQLTLGYAASGRRKLLEEMVLDCELELGRVARAFRLRILELPLAEPRAWFIGPDRIIMSQQLPADEELFRSYLEPVIRMLI